MSTPLLKTSHFAIRAFERKDLEAFTDYRSLEKVARFQSWTTFSYQDAVELFEKMDYTAFGADGHWYQLAIVTLETDELMGDLAIHFIDQDQVEIGFTVSPQYQGKHIATQAVSTLLTFIFGTLNRHRVIATTDEKNVASNRLLEKLGFRKEAHFVKGIFFKGAWGDEYQYAMLHSEFRDRGVS